MITLETIHRAIIACLEKAAEVSSLPLGDINVVFIPREEGESVGSLLNMVIVGGTNPSTMVQIEEVENIIVPGAAILKVRNDYCLDPHQAVHCCTLIAGCEVIPLDEDWNFIPDFSVELEPKSARQPAMAAM